jgi:hypothetical protein
MASTLSVHPDCLRQTHVVAQSVTAALSSFDALIVNLGRQHASTVAHNQSTLRAHGPFPVIWCGPDDALRDRQRKRNAILPAFDIVTGGRVCNPTILSRYARICAVEHCCRRSGGLRGNRRCQRKRRDYHLSSGAEGRYRVAVVSPSRCRKKERRTHDDHLRPRKSAFIISSGDPDRAPQRGVGARGRPRSPAGLAGYVRRPRRAA